MRFALSGEGERSHGLIWLMEQLKMCALKNIPSGPLSASETDSASQELRWVTQVYLYLKKKIFFSTSLEIDAAALELNLDSEGK